MKVSSLKGGVRDLHIVFKESDGFEEGDLNIEYRPGELTFAEFEKLQEGIKSDGGEADATIHILAKVLVSWDLEMDEVDENGDPTGEVVPVPASAEGLKIVPLPALGFIFGEMMEDVRPKGPKDETSDDGSQQKETPERSLVGTS